ncbi:MAG: hypothetical protein WKF84_20575 [Pyrinomonadaceae bacterium]
MKSLLTRRLRPNAVCCAFACSGRSWPHCFIKGACWCCTASAVEIEGSSVAFLGGKGWGKSTLAAYLQAQQHSLLADDVVAIDLELSGTARVLPGFPQLKLWPSAITYLGLSSERMPQLQSGLDKRAHRLDCDFPQTSRPLKKPLRA